MTHLGLVIGWFFWLVLSLVFLYAAVVALFGRPESVLTGINRALKTAVIGILALLVWQWTCFLFL